VLVVVEHGDAHAVAEVLLDDEAVRRLDVLEVDGTEGRLQGGDDVGQAPGVLLVDFDVENVDAGELLEQYRLALHHRLGGQRADVAKAEDGGAVGDDGDEIAADRRLPRRRRIGGDVLAGRGNPGRIGECQVPLGAERFGRCHLQLSRLRFAVVVEGLFSEVLVHRRALSFRSGPGCRAVGGWSRREWAPLR